MLIPQETNADATPISINLGSNLSTKYGITIDPSIKCPTPIKMSESFSVILEETRKFCGTICKIILCITHYNPSSFKSSIILFCTLVGFSGTKIFNFTY